MNIKSIALIASAIVATSASVWAAPAGEQSCGAGSCSKKAKTQTSDQAHVVKKGVSEVQTKDAACSKGTKETACSKNIKDAACSKGTKDAACSKKAPV